MFDDFLNYNNLSTLLTICGMCVVWNRTLLPKFLPQFVRTRRDGQPRPNKTRSTDFGAAVKQNQQQLFLSVSVGRRARTCLVLSWLVWFCLLLSVSYIQRVSHRVARAFCVCFKTLFKIALPTFVGTDNIYRTIDLLFKGLGFWPCSWPPSRWHNL